MNLLAIDRRTARFRWLRLPAQGHNVLRIVPVMLDVLDNGRLDGSVIASLIG
jgi:hypothetical protein